jgi:hypothetical protein
MAQIDALFAGTGSEEEVYRAATHPEARFYAHLYAGLWHEARGNCPAAREAIRKAAGLAEAGHYMGAVARFHATAGTCRK